MSNLSWRAVADLLAERMFHQAHCADHAERDADLANCPSCRDRAAYRAWEAKSGRTHREQPYAGPVLDIFAAERHRDGDA